MGTVLVFNGGERVRVIGTNAPTLTRNLDRVRQGPIRLPSGENLAPGWVDVQTEDGVILVNPAAVAYVRDVEDSVPRPGQSQAASLSGLEARPVQGQV